MARTEKLDHPVTTRSSAFWDHLVECQVAEIEEKVVKQTWSPYRRYFIRWYEFDDRISVNCDANASVFCPRNWEIAA